MPHSIHPDSSASLLVLEPDDDIRPLLKSNLETHGYTVLIALDEADAIQRAMYTPAIDLILINQAERSTEAAIAIGQHIRQQSNLAASIPIVILAEDYTVQMEGRNVQIAGNQFVAYLEHGQQLLDLLDSLLY